MIGTTLAHYRITAALGAGGMGEVWRATDEKLGREVALKVLPEAFAEDPNRMARFEREAKVLASLNHPNIAHLYGLESVNTRMAAGTAARSGSADGFAVTSNDGPVRAEPEGRSPMAHASRVQAADSESHLNAEAGPTTFLVMELVEGEDLSERITRGPIPIDEAIPIALQIARALEAAHEQGIVHRDLKPANIKLTDDGVVKVLDFGLAKAWEMESGDVNSSLSPTITRHATLEGVILGTAAYMSPEQARGKSVDKRADIWAFGVVLFEMLSGRRQFEGETVSDVLAAVLTHEPPWDTLPAATPIRVRRLLARCLERDPKQRLRDIGDARLELAVAPSGEEDVPEGAPRARATLPWALAAVSLLTLAGVAASFWAGLWSTSPSDAPPTRLSIALPAGQAVTSAPAISRDGRVVAFTAGGASEPSQLYIRRLDEFESHAVAQTTGAESPFFSPDGRSIGFFAGGRLMRWDVGGAYPLPLTDAPTPMGGTWGDDGTIVFVPLWNGGLYRINASGGTPEALLRPDGVKEYAFVFPRFVPGREEVLFTHWGNDRGLSRVSLSGTDRTMVVPEGGSGLVTTSGHLLYVQAISPWAGILAAPYSELSVNLSSANLVLSDFFFPTWEPDPWVSVSSTGTLAYVPSEITQRSLVLVDETGRGVPATEQRGLYGSLALSPDGRRIAVDDEHRIWVYEVGGSGRVRLAPENRDYDEGYPVWSADGSRVLYASNETGKWEVYARAPGAAMSELIMEREFDWYVVAIAPDGTFAFQESNTITGDDIWFLPPGGEPTPGLAGPGTDALCDFSPDGRWIVYASDESGRSEIYVKPFRSEGERLRVTTEGGNAPVWSPKGDRLFYRQGAKMMVADVIGRDPLAISRPRLLFEGGWDLPPGKYLERSFEVAPDGEHFVMIRHEPESIPDRINIVLNWCVELERQIPAGKGDRP